MKYFISLILSIYLFNSFSQISIVNENFNNGIPVNWEIINNDSLPISQNSSVNFVTNGFVIRENPDNLNVGDSLLMASSWHEIIGDADDYLILPQLTLGSFGNFICFDARSIDFTHPEGLEVIISTNGSEISDFLIEEPVFSNLVMSPYWTTYCISLDSLGLQNQSINIAFRHFGNDQYLLALDNIIIEMENPVSIHESSKVEYSIYPNPTSDMLYINGIEHKHPYTIYDCLGKVVTWGYYEGVINIFNLDQGIYFIELEGIERLSFIKK